MINFYTNKYNISFTGIKKTNYNIADIRNLHRKSPAMTDYFAKSRNGHLLKDTFNKQSNTLDIYSSGLYPANILSNLAYKPFVFDGVPCSSIEGFLQSLKIPDIETQRRTCLLYGGSAKNFGKKHADWMNTQVLYWNNKEYARDSQEYYDLLYSAYKSCYTQNSDFKQALDTTKGKILTHNTGKTDKQSTVITKQEFIDILNRLRQEG